SHPSLQMHVLRSLLLDADVRHDLLAQATGSPEAALQRPGRVLGIPPARQEPERRCELAATPDLPTRTTLPALQRAPSPDWPAERTARTRWAPQLRVQPVLAVRNERDRGQGELLHLRLHRFGAPALGNHEARPEGQARTAGAGAWKA